MTKHLSYEAQSKELLNGALAKKLGGTTLADPNWRLISTGKPLDWEQYYYDAGDGVCWSMLALTDVEERVIAGMIVHRRFRRPVAELSLLVEQHFVDDNPQRADHLILDYDAIRVLPAYK